MVFKKKAEEAPKAPLMSEIQAMQVELEELKKKHASDLRKIKKLTDENTELKFKVALATDLNYNLACQISELKGAE